MTSKLTILIAIGLLVFGAFVFIIVKAWRYRRNHPNEVYWPYCGTLRRRHSKQAPQKLLLAALTLASLLCGSNTFAQDGTYDNPYFINDLDAFLSFAQCINSGQNFSYQNGIFVPDANGPIPAYGEGTYFRQIANIDLAGITWHSIGTSPTTGFRGNYDGDVNNIINLKLTANQPALFCYSTGTIGHLTMQDPVFADNVNNSGALATYVMGGTIRDCHVNCSPGSPLVFNGKNCGALIGCIGIPDGQKADDVTIDMCSSNCEIISNYQQTSANDQNSVAGVVAVINAHHYLVTRCYNLGNIISTYRPKFQEDTLSVAGVVGRGLVPTTPSLISKCYNKGRITAHCGYIGGVAGLFDAESGLSNNTRCNIDYCFNTGRITGVCVLYSSDTMPSNYYSLSPQLRPAADSTLNILSVGGVLAPCKAKTRYSFNTGIITLTKHPHPKFNIKGDQGVVGLGSIAEHCFNVGEIYNYETRNGRAAGVASDTARYCINAVAIYDRNLTYSYLPRSISNNYSINCIADAQMAPDGLDGILFPSVKIFGGDPAIMDILGDEHWVFGTNVYPQLKWTQEGGEGEDAKDFAIAASEPIFLSDIDIYHVTNPFRLGCFDTKLNWRVPKHNCLVTIDNQSCSGGFIWPTVDTVSECDIIVPLTAILSSDDTIKVTHLLHSITPPSDILTVDNLNELKMLRDSVNSGKSFFYKNHKLPRYAEGVTFKLTTDLNMGYQRPWEPIGSVMSGSRFAGRFLGDGHTIYNLSLDNATPNRDKNANFGGLFGMLSGEVRDLIFENLSADSTTIVAGAVCALMNGATIENCIVKGHIETSKSNNYYALSGIGGIAGVSLTAHIQDSIFQCSDTIRGCINYADITTHVGRGKNIAFHSVGGIIGHGGVVIDCANAGNISASKDCGYLGGIGGDLTSALRCFNTGRINIEEANQTGNFYVGGVVGLNEADSAVRYCYNAGPIHSSDRNYVGGIIGKGNPKYCYTSNTTICRGAHTGSIVGISEHDQNCYYDKQMSPMAANNGSNIPARSVKGFETTAMLGSALSDSLGDNTNWIFTPGLYPQLAGTRNDADLQRVAVMPVVLGSGQNWATAHDSIPLKGCDDHYFWKKISGNVSVNDCNVHTSNRDKGTMEFAATLDSVPYRYITLIFNLEESHAYVITSLRQFDTMRMVINQGGYYNLIDSTFHLTIPAGANANDFIAIMDGGKDCYFKLTASEIDIEVLRWSDNAQKHWTPIGGYADNTCGFEGRTFKGIFDGNGCTVKRLQFEGCNNPRIGLFGVIEGGTVKNLILDNPKGDIHYDTIGFLCSINKGGTIYNCEIVNSVWEFDTLVYMSSNIGFFCGKNEKGIIDSCRIKDAKILRLPGAINTYNRHNMGGICALNDRGVISRCRVEDFRYEDRSDFYTIVENLGGICGKNYHGQLLNDTIARSRFLLRVAKQYKNVGGICGLSGFSSDDTDKEASYGYMPSVIDGCVNDGFTFTADTCNGYGNCIKNIRHVGGIVGMCQGQNITLTNCHNLAGKISVCADSVGGICGRFINEGGDSYIHNCSNHVNVTGSSYVGGVVGIIDGANIYDSQNYGTIRAAAGPRYWPEKPAGYYAGGIAGALTGKSGLITCSNSGLVNTDSNYVGGMAGAMLENSRLYLCTNNGTVRGRDQVGGLAGLVCQNAWFDNCTVLGEGKVSGIAQVGGLVGYLKGVGAHTCRDSRNDAQKIFYASMGGGVYGYAEDPTMLENCSSTNIVRYDAVMDISSIEQLLSFRQNVNNGNTYEGTLVRLNSNLEITSDWEPIGKNPEHPFRGIFDGLDHSIKYTINVNYPYNYDEEDYYYQGLFGYMEGTVRNLDLVDCSISADNSDYVGLVAGYCHGSILDCGSYAHYDSPKVKGRNYVGGLVGMAYNSEIKNCYNGLNVSGKQYVGGIVGDFTANKNIVTYGGMPYNLYGGNVNQCFNYGMIQSRITLNCYAGGIAGSTSTEIKHCYNSGSVNGSHRAGGIAGQLLGDSIHHCYNTGYLPYGSLQMAIVSDCGPTNGYSIYDCFYDKQMCTAEEVNATGLFTSEMVAGTNSYSSIRAALGDEYWTYNNNEYPSLTRFYQKAGIIVPISVKPLLLPGYMPVDNIMVNFSGATGNDSCDQDTRVVWSRYNTLATTVVDMGDCMPYKDSILIISKGYDTLRVSYNQPLGVQRLVPVRVRNVPENFYVSNVTAFNSYTWPVNNTTYGKSGFYTHSETQQFTQKIIYYALNLTIVNVDCRIEQVKGTCGTIPDGALLSTVSGGTGNGFRYKWTHDNNDSLGNLPNLANILPGTYHLTLTDSLISTCVLTQTVTLGEPEPVNLTISGCSESKDYDGTPFTVYRYVVQEEGYAPDTLNEGQCAILSNGDTLHVSLSNPVNISNPFDSPEGVSITSYSITNGIDHRCHYHVTLEAGSVTINKRPVTITVNDASKTSGENDPVFSGTVTGLVHDNDLGTISFYRTDATQPDVVGTYVDVLTATYTENTNYVVTVNNGTFTINCKHTLLSITNWPDTTTVPGVCFAPTNTDLLPSDSAFQAKYDWNVTHTDSVLRSDPCDWLCARTYTNTGNPVDYNVYCELESRVMYISGGDTTGPKLTIDTLKVDACRFKGDIDDIIPDKQELIFDDCSGVAAISYTQDTTVNHPSWTIRRIYELRDFCGNLNFDTLYICGVDTIPPMPDPRAFPQRVVNDTLWADPVCRCDTNPANFIQITDNPHRVVRRFDLIDNCDDYDENSPYSLRVLSAEKTVKIGENCVDTAVISYVVSDRSGNTATYYHAQLIIDTTPPTFDIVPKDTTLCLLGPGLYKETVNSVIYDENNDVIDRVANIHDNCTKLQGSFVVHNSIDTGNYTVVNGIRQYEQYWTVTDSCGNSFTDKMIIKVNPLPTIRIDTLGTQTITYGEMIQDITIYNEYSTLSVTLGEEGLNFNSNNSTVSGSLDSVGTYSYTATATSNQTPSCGSVDTVIWIYVNPRPITIAAGSATKKYDGTPLTSPYYECTLIDPDNRLNGIPILNIDTIAGLTITGSQTDVGSSANVPSNAVITRRTDATVNMNSSYDVSYANGTLTVTTNDTLIRVIPGSGTKVYDGTPLTVTAHDDFTVTGVPLGLTWTATADGTVTNVTPGAGEKAVNAVTEFHIFDAGGNDVTAFFTSIDTTAKGTLTITPRPVVIIVNDASKEVGDPDPTFSGTITGLVDGEENALATISFSRTNEDQSIGTYPDVLTASYTTNPNYSVSINKGDFLINCRRLTTRISNWPEAEITGLDECFYPATNNSPSPNTDTLPSAAQIQTWIAQANSLPTSDFTIAVKDTALKSSACDWEWERIYTITSSNPGYCDEETRVLHVSGGDQSAPVRSNAWPWDFAGIPYQNACLERFNMDLYLPQDQDLFDDCSELFITHSDVSWGDDRDGWTIQRSYVVSDSCGHTIYDTIRVSGRDQTPPVASNPEVKNNTLWADYVQCLCDSIHVINNFSEIVSLFGLSDECTGDNISLVSKTKTLKTGNRCADTVVVAYTVADLYGNDTTFYHAQLIQDTIRPTFDIVPREIALCLIGPGKYGETVNSVIYDENNQVINRVANIQDNCTKLQGSFEVHNSIDLNNYTVVNGIRQYEQYWTVTDSCGNSLTDKMIIKVNPLPTIRIDTLGTQTIIYGEQIQDITINNEYSVVSLTPSDRGLVYSEGKVTGWLDSVGTYSYTATATSNQTPSCGSVDTVIKFYVNPRPITIAAGSATKKYDGTPLTSPYYECTLIDPNDRLNGIPILNIDTIAGLTITGSQTDVGSSANVPSDAVITRRGDVTVNMNSCYDVTYANGTLTVTTNDTLIKVIPADGSKEYDGTPLTKTAHEDFTVTGVPEGLTWEATADGMVTNVIPGEGEKAVNAVTSFKIFDADGHDVTAFFTNIQDSIGTLTITPKSLTITAGDSTKEYDGTTLTNSNYSYLSSDLAAGETLVNVTVTGSQTFAGTSANVPSAAVIKNDEGDTVNANYNITYVNGTLEVTQRPLTITAASDTKVYDGSFLTKNSYTHTDLAAGDSLWSVTITGKNALVGENSNVPSDAVIKNAAGDTVTNSYNIHYVNGTLRIKVKALTITTRDSSKVYDGTELICHTYTCTGLCATDSIKDVEMLSKITYAGTIDNVIGSVDIVNHNNISIAGKDTDVTNCYQIQYIYGKLAVTKKDLTITADSATKVYDGTPLTKKSYTHSELVPGDSITTIIITGSQTVAGSSYNVPEGARIDNNNDPVTESYNITYVNGTLTVTKKPLTITADGATKEYDGTALTKGTYTHTALITGDSIRSVTIIGSQTLIGSSNNVPSAAVIKNDTLLDITDCYEITYANGTLEVTPNTSEIVVTPSGGNKTYDGTPLTKTALNDFTVTGVPEGFTWTAAADGTVTNVVPGDGEKAVNAVSEFKIFNAVSEDVTNQFANITTATDTLSITPKEVTMTSGSKTREYNGLALTNDEVEGRNANGLTEESGWIAGEGATYSFTGSQQSVGESANAFTCIPNNNTLVSNYNIHKTEGVLKITANTTELKAVSADGTWTYDGNAHTKYEYTVTYGNESYPVTITAPATSGTATLSTGDVVTITPAASAKITHVAQGNVTNAFSMDITNGDQYSNQTKNEGLLTVTPTTLTVMTGTASREYNGSPLTAVGSISGLVTPTGGSQETATFTVTGSQTFVGNSTNTYSLTWDGSAVGDDYTINETLGTLTITASTKELKVVSAEGTWTYDGNTHTKYEYAVTYDTESYNVSISSGASTGAVTLSTGDVVTITPAASAKITHVAEGNVTNAFNLTVENSDQYSNKTKTEDTLKLTPASLTITTESDSKGYDGTPLTASGSISGFATPTGGSQETATFAVTGSQTVVGTSQNSYSLVWDGTAVESDYTLTENIGTLKVGVNHLPIVITSGDHEFNYDGQAHSYPSYQVTYDGFQVDRIASDSTKFMLPTGDMLSVNNAASITYYDASASHNNTFDYVIENADYYNAASHSSVYGTININLLSTPLQIASLGYTWTYDGNRHQYKHYTVQFAGAYISGNAMVNDTVFALPTGDTLTITDAPSITDAGKVANTFSYTLQHDFQYMGIRDTVVDTLRVNPLTGVEVTVKEHGGVTTYDGYEQRVTGYNLVSINNGLYTSSDFYYSGTEEDSISKGRYVGNYPMNIMPADFTNDNPNFADVLFIIEDSSLLIEPNPAVITITAGSSEKLYDGTPLVDSSYTYTPAGIFAQGDSLVVEISGMISGVGQVDNEVVDYKVYRNESFNGSMVHSGLRMASPAGYTKDVTDCYTFANEMVKGKLVIYEALTLTLDSISETLCMGRDEGFVKYRATGGKPATPKYNYQVEGTVTHDTYTGTFDSTFRISSLRPDTYEVTVTESLGYTITSSFVIDVREVITEANSSLTCPADIDTLIRHGGCHLELLDLGTPVFSTTTSLPMSEITISNNAPADHLYPAGETVVTWVAKSLCGDSITCEQKITVSFAPCSDAVDYEGNHYPSVRLGSGCKCWTTENLKSTKYSDGRAIEDVMSYYSSQFPNTTENVNIFGHLYNWYAAADTQRYGSVDSVERAYNLGHRIQGICPEGWYLPTDEDFEELNMYPVNDLRSTSYWINGGNNTNATGFNSLPGGMYNCSTSRFEDGMGLSFYWSCHPVFDLASGALIDYVCERIREGNFSRCNGFSVRCVLEEH